MFYFVLSTKYKLIFNFCLVGIKNVYHIYMYLSEQIFSYSQFIQILFEMCNVIFQNTDKLFFYGVIESYILFYTTSCTCSRICTFQNEFVFIIFHFECIHSNTQPISIKQCIFRSTQISVCLSVQFRIVCNQSQLRIEGVSILTMYVFAKLKSQYFVNFRVL